MVPLLNQYPGFGGQTFIQSQIRQTARMRALFGDRQINIQVDGYNTRAIRATARGGRIVA